MALPRLKLTLIALALVVAAGMQTASAARADGPIVIELVSVTTSLKTMDKKPTGPSRGDVYFSTSVLYNVRAQFGKPRAARVGSDRGTVTFVTRATSRVSVTVTLPGGTLTVRGLVGADGTAPVVAGSGRYAGASGALLIKQTGPSTALNLYRLSYPLSA